MEAKQPRHLLDFPITVMEIIVKKLAPIDVVSLSLTSIKATKVVKGVHPRIALIYVHLGKKNASIILKNLPACHGERHVLRILNRDDQSGEATGANVLYSPVYKRVDIREVEDAKFNSKCLVTKGVVANREQAVNIALNHICDIFNQPVFRVMVNADTYPHIGDLLLWKLVNACCDFEIEGGKQLKRSEMKKVFRKVHIGSRLAVPDTSTEGLLPHFNKIKHLDLLHIFGACWFNNHHLAQLDCEYAFICCSQVTGLGLNQVLKKWLASTDTRIRSLTVGSHRKILFADVFKGLEKQRFNVTCPDDEKVAGFGSFLRPIHIGKSAVMRADGAAAIVDFRFHDRVAILVDYDVTHVRPI